MQGGLALRQQAGQVLGTLPPTVQQPAGAAEGEERQRSDGFALVSRQSSRLRSGSLAASGQQKFREKTEGAGKCGSRRHGEGLVRVWGKAQGATATSLRSIALAEVWLGQPCKVHEVHACWLAWLSPGRDPCRQPTVQCRLQPAPAATPQGASQEGVAARGEQGPLWDTLTVALSHKPAAWLCLLQCCRAQALEAAA